MANLAIIDLSGLFWRNWHATGRDEMSAAYELTMGAISKLIDNHTYVAVAADSTPYDRAKIYPGYKAQREKPDPVAIEQLRKLKEHLGARYALWEHAGAEADDIIASAVAAARQKPWSVAIISSDKDLLQLVSDKDAVWVHSPYGVFDEEAVRRKFEVSPCDMLGLLALAGDQSDNVPGVKGIGPKRAAQLLKEHGSFQRICDLIELGDPDKLLAKIGGRNADACRASLLAEKERLMISALLVKLKSSYPINLNDVLVERRSRTPEPDPFDMGGQEEDEYDDPFAGDPIPGEPDPEPAKAAPASKEAQQHDGKTPVLEMPDRDALIREMAAKEASIAAKKECGRTAAAMTDNVSGTEETPAKAEEPDDTRDTEVPPRMAVPPPPPVSASLARDWIRELEPGNLAAAMKVANAFYNARCFGLPNPEAGLAMIMAGRPMGLGAARSCMVFHIIRAKGGDKLAMSADLMIGLIQAHPDCEYFYPRESDHTKATYVTKRRGYPEEVVLTFTIEDARKMGLADRKTKSGEDTPWQSNTREMLSKTCGVFLGRKVFRDVITGVYALEELVDD